MPRRFFLDANVLFTAAISERGASRAIIDLAQAGRCTVFSSAFAFDEAERNIRSKRPAGLAAIVSFSRIVETVPEADVAMVAWAATHVPAKDAPILAAAVAARVDVLVTGDRRHFGSYFGRLLQTVTVMPPREALEALLAA